MGPSKWPVERPSRPGVMVFNLSLGLLYINQEAQDLSGQLVQDRQGHGRGPSAQKPLLATDLLCLSEEVARQLRLRADAKHWDQVYIRRTLDHQGHPLVLQAFGIPDAGCMGRSVIILLLEDRKPSPPRETGRQIAQAKERFQLTDREQSVAEHLSRGFTNKEIASTLGITEQTIKVHVKHIMEKTDSTTRTAVLAHLFQLPPAACSQPVRAAERRSKADSSRQADAQMSKAARKAGAAFSTAWFVSQRYRVAR